MQVPLQSNYYDCRIFICLYAAFLDIRLPLSFSQHDTRNARTWMAHEMTEEGKLLKMIHRVLHDSLLASATGNSAPTSDNSTAISRSTTDTVDTTSTATTTGDQQQSKRSSESQLQGAIKRQRTYEPENEITKPPDLTDLHHQQQKSPDTVNTETQQDENMHNIPKEPNETIGEHQITHARDKDRTPTRAKEFTGEYTEPNTTATPQGIRMLVAEARRRSRQLKKRRMCAPPRHSGTSCEPLTVSKTRLQRPTR